MIKTTIEMAVKKSTTGSGKKYTHTGHSDFCGTCVSVESDSLELTEEDRAQIRQQLVDVMGGRLSHGEIEIEALI